MDVRVLCLGRLRLRVGDGAPQELGPTRAGELLAHLVLAEDMVRSRAQVRATLWPDHDEQHARRRLRQGLWELRTRYGLNAHVRAEGDAVALDATSPPWVDARAFEALARADDRQGLSQALDLYRGDLLEGWLQEWVLPHRRRLRELAVEALARLVRLERAEGRHEAALGYAQQRARMAPLDEEAHRDVMRLCALLERWNEGLHQAEACRELLLHEMGLEPSEATEAVRRRLLDARDDAAQSIGAPPGRSASPDEAQRSLVGRVRERRLLISAAEEALADRAGIAFLEGDAGIGKSRLLRELAEDARWRGLDVLWGEGRRDGRGEPYGVLARALRGLAGTTRLKRLRERLPGAWWRHIAIVVPELRDPADDGGGARPPQEEAVAGRQLRAALAGMVRALAELHPLLLVVDDAQWADPATMQALAELVRQTPPAPVVVVVAYRRAEARKRSALWRAVKQLDTDARAAPLRLELDPLDMATSLHLVQAELGVTDDAVPLATWLHERTRGHPLFLLEALRAVRRSGRLQEGPAGALRLPRSRSEVLVLEREEFPASEELEALVRRQRRQLSPPARRLLDGLAVAGEDCQASLVEMIAEPPGANAYEALEELTRWGLIREGPAGWGPTHELMRRAAYRAMPAARRRELHGRVADAMARTGSPAPHALAVHFARSRRWREAAEAYGRAAREAAALGAHEEALAHAREAQRTALQGGAGDRERFELLAEEEACLHVLARRDEQRRVLAAMAERAAGETQRLEVHLRRARALVRTARPEEAMAEAARAQRLAEASGGTRPVARTLETFGTVAYEAGRAHDALPALERAVAHFDRQGALAAAAAARTRLGAVYGELQEFPRAEVCLREALRAYRELDDARGEAEVEARLGVVHRQQGFGEAAERSYLRALERFRAVGDRWAEAQTATNLGLLLNARGRVADALAWLDAAMTIAGEIGERRGEAIARANAASIRQALLGEHEAARTDAEAALNALATLGEVRLRPLPELVLANVRVDEGDPRGGAQRLEKALAASRANGHRWMEAQVQRDLTRARLLHGDTDAALRHAGEGLALAVRLGLATLTVELRALRGRALSAAGDVEAALHETAAAMESRLSGVNRAYLAPFARHEALAAAGRDGEAANAIEEAHEALRSALHGLPEERLQRSLQRVPEHRALVEAYRAWRPVRMRVELPTAKGRRKSAAGPVASVCWTPSDPEDLRVEDRRARRRRQVARLVREAREQGGVPTAAALAQALQVSPSTVKRDLARLRKEPQANTGDAHDA